MKSHPAIDPAVRDIYAALLMDYLSLLWSLLQGMYEIKKCDYSSFTEERWESRKMIWFSWHNLKKKKSMQNHGYLIEHGQT